MAHSASKIPFVALCQVLEGIQSKKSVADKRKLLQKFVDEWRSKTFDPANQEDSFYPMLRCMVPQLEKIAYGVKQHSLGRLYVDVMGLGKKSEAAGVLMNYKNPTMSASVNKNLGDFAECAYSVLKDRCSVRSELSVMHVIDKLNDIANGYTGKDKLLVKSTLEYLIKNLTGLENKWFIRMLVKDMKLGLGQDSILSAVHPDAPALFNVDTSLERVCLKLRDINKRLHEVEVSLFAPLKPMLGKQAKPNEVEAQLQCPDFILERKFDGERMQLHMDKGEYKYFSRNGHDYTSTYGATQFEGNLTPRIHSRLKGVKNCILDGEMCGYDQELQVLGTKAMNFDIKSANLSRYTPCYAVFDILYLNGEVLTNKPLKERLKKMSDIVEDEEGVVFASTVATGSTNKECIDALNQAIDRYEEGIMVKHPESVYKPNSRTAGWYKIKPEYVDGLMDELDIVIVGGYFGKGRRANILSHFLCAVMDNSCTPAKFHSVTKVGSGYTYKELLDFNLKLKSRWQKTQPSTVLVSKEKPDIWIDPMQSAILQVKATEVVESSSFYTGHSLRFPRVEKIRDDKDPSDCLTLADFDQLRTKRSGQLTAGILTDELLEEPKLKKRRNMGPRSVAPTIAQQFQAADVSSITKEVDTFNNKEFCIVQGSKAHTKQQLEQEIVKMGGTIVQNAGTDTFCIVTDKMTIKIRNYMKADKHNIARLEWLSRCIESRTFQKWEPCDMIHACPSLQRVFDVQYDRFGDEHATNTSTDQLRKIFSLMPPRKPADPLVDREEIQELEEESLTNEDYDRALFRNCRFYDGDAGDKSRTTLNLLQSRFYGGAIADRLDEKVTHCVCQSLENVEKLKQVNQTRERKFYIVTPAWIEEGIEAGKLLKERAFAVL